MNRERHFKQWTDYEEQQLVSFVQSGKSISSIASAMGRTKDAIAQRIREINKRENNPFKNGVDIKVREEGEESDSGMKTELYLYIGGDLFQLQSGTKIVTDKFLLEIF